MSLYLLNAAHRDGDPDYVGYLQAMRGPARVAVATRIDHGTQALGRLYTAYGIRVFDRWRYPDPTECEAAMRAALDDVGLPADLGRAFDSTAHDADLDRSHAAAIALVGDEGGTPVVTIDGAACYGPVLSSIPRGKDALRIFEGARLLAGWSDFAELKRTRVTASAFA